MPCFVTQGLRAARLSTDDPALQQAAIDEVFNRMRGLDLQLTPAKLSDVVYAAVRDITGVADPFAQTKRETNQRAMRMAPELRERAEASPDPFHTAVKIALVGNVIDLGISRPFDLERDVENILQEELTIDDYDAFANLLDNCNQLLYICDNSGEIAFDTRLIEKLKTHCNVTAAVKSGPVINDATMADAREVGLTDMVKVIETGAAAIGIDWPNSSDQFRKSFQTADIIIAKGQGNYETLNENNLTPKIFFLLKVKCPIVAEALHVAEGSTVFKRG